MPNPTLKPHVSSKTQLPYPNQDKDPKPQAKSSSILRNYKEGIQDLQNLNKIKIGNMGVTETIDHIKLKIKVPNSSLE